MTDDFTLGDLTSEKGWVRTNRDFRMWIPCPPEFAEEPGSDRDSWAMLMAEGWWEQSGLKYGPDAVGKLAFMLKTIQEHAYERIPCHQVWIYYRDMTEVPLPLHIGIWKMTGDRSAQLRALSGADDRDIVRPSSTTEFTTDLLGTGYRTIRHKADEAGRIIGFLGFAFRSEEFETDVQALVGTPDLRQLQKASADIGDFVRGLRVYYNPAKS
jgi:hypothetical protein